MEFPEKGLPVFSEAQYLITARRDRRMQVNRKLSMITRNRNLNRKETRLAVGKKKVADLQELIATREAEMDTIAQQSNEATLESEKLLRESDQMTIDAIHNADVMKANCVEMLGLLDELRVDNNLLLCHNHRREEQIHLVDRFINAVYRVIPEENRSELLKSYYEKHKYGGTGNKAEDPANFTAVRDILKVTKRASVRLRQIYSTRSLSQAANVFSVLS